MGADTADLLPGSQKTPRGSPEVSSWGGGPEALQVLTLLCLARGPGGTAQQESRPPWLGLQGTGVTLACGCVFPILGGPSVGRGGQCVPSSAPHGRGGSSRRPVSIHSELEGADSCPSSRPSLLPSTPSCLSRNLHPSSPQWPCCSSHPGPHPCGGHCRAVTQGAGPGAGQLLDPSWVSGRGGGRKMEGRGGEGRKGGRGRQGERGRGYGDCSVPGGVELRLSPVLGQGTHPCSGS